jgi:hypothetical protein
MFQHLAADGRGLGVKGGAGLYGAMHVATNIYHICLQKDIQFQEQRSMSIDLPNDLGVFLVGYLKLDAYSFDVIVDSQHGRKRLIFPEQRAEKLFLWRQLYGRFIFATLLATRVFS